MLGGGGVGRDRGAAGRVERPEHAGGVRRFVAPGRELALKIGEAKVGEGGVQGDESGREARGCQACGRVGGEGSGAERWPDSAAEANRLGSKARPWH